MDVSGDLLAIPPNRIVDEWTDQPAGVLPNDPYAENPEDRPGSITREQSAAMHAKFAELGITDRNARMAVIRQLLGIQVSSSRDLSYAQADRLLAALKEKAKNG